MISMDFAARIATGVIGGMITLAILYSIFTEPEQENADHTYWDDEGHYD